jgi:hypothetical protein
MKLQLGLILILSIFLHSCFDTSFQSTRFGNIVPNLSKTNQIAISDGSDIFLLTPDSIINDSTNLKIVFATKSPTIDKEYHHNLFTVYESGIYPGFRGPDTHYNLVSDGTNSIELNFNSKHFKNGDRLIVIWRGEVIKPTYKIIK